MPSGSTKALLSGSETQRLRATRESVKWSTTATGFEDCCFRVKTLLADDVGGAAPAAPGGPESQPPGPPSFPRGLAEGEQDEQHGRWLNSASIPLPVGLQYPPHWVDLTALHAAMFERVDPVTGRPRGYMIMGASPLAESVLLTLDRRNRCVPAVITFGE